MILHLPVDFKELQAQGRDYQWPRPERCLRCGLARPWGHGYVARAFDGCAAWLWLKRYRCAACRTVYTLRPDTHYRGFWAPQRVILAALLGRLKGARWLRRVSRQRQQYWWRGLRRQLVLEGALGRATSAALKALVERLVIASTHSLKYRVMQRIGGEQPYLIFAVPGVGGEVILDTDTNHHRRVPWRTWRTPKSNRSPCSGSE